MQSSPLIQEFGSCPGDYKLDICALVTHAQSFVVVIKPVIYLYRGTVDFLSWKYPGLSVTLLVVVNITTVLFPATYLMLCHLLLLSTLMLIGLLHKYYNILAKVLPLSSDSCYVAAEQDHHERMQEFRLLLVLVDKAVLYSISFILEIYSILKWDKVNLSLLCYLLFFVSVILLHTIQLRWCFLLLFNIVLFWTPFIQSLFVSGILVRIDSNQNNGLSKQTNCTKSSDDENLSDMEISSSASSNHLPKRSLSKSQKVMDKLLDLRRRQPAAVIEKCSSCSVMFTSILKRKHICSHCGNHYCSRCCSHKVPRASFGATAPAAQTETVAVCSSCFEYLTKKEKVK